MGRQGASVCIKLKVNININIDKNVIAGWLPYGIIPNRETIRVYLVNKSASPKWSHQLSKTPESNNALLSCTVLCSGECQPMKSK
jgi:hypothetical protein